MSVVPCPHCNEPLVVIAGKVFKSPIPEDEDRCEEISIIHHLRCQLIKNHGGQHEHFPYVWGNMGGPAWWDELAREQTSRRSGETADKVEK